MLQLSKIFLLRVKFLFPLDKRMKIRLLKSTFPTRLKVPSTFQNIFLIPYVQFHRLLVISAISLIYRLWQFSTLLLQRSVSCNCLYSCSLLCEFSSSSSSNWSTNRDNFLSYIIYINHHSWNYPLLYLISLQFYNFNFIIWFNFSLLDRQLVIL